MDLINFIIYLTFWFSGTVFGSFFTLAVHRIPRHEDITHQRSYCPKCNHKLQFLDLIPVFSYLFLGGKCRYCKEKIRPRYLILEICSGIVFVILAKAHNISILSTAHNYIMLCFDVLFICFMFISAGIYKEHKTIPNGVMTYGIIVAIARAIYWLYHSYSIHPGVFDISREVLRFGVNWIIALLIPTILFISDKAKKDKEYASKEDCNYLVVLGFYFLVLNQLIGFGISVVIAIIYYLAKCIIELIKEKDRSKVDLFPKDIPLSFFFSIGFTILMLILGNSYYL